MPNIKKDAKKKSTSFSLTEEALTKLKQMAEKDDRSITYVVEKMILDHPFVVKPAKSKK